jgi:hypothetical protein
MSLAPPRRRCDRACACRPPAIGEATQGRRAACTATRWEESAFNSISASSSSLPIAI